MPEDRRAVEDRGELLFRQVHPDFISDGRPSSQVFKPFPKDNGQLSVSLSSKTTPEASYRHHTKTLGYRSGGVWGLEVGEVDSLGLIVYETPEVSPPPDPSHAEIDFTSVDRLKGKHCPARLATFARARGVLYPAADAPVTSATVEQ